MFLFSFNSLLKWLRNLHDWSRLSLEKTIRYTCTRHTAGGSFLSQKVLIHMYLTQYFKRQTCTCTTSWSLTRTPEVKLNSTNLFFPLIHKAIGLCWQRNHPWGFTVFLVIWLAYLLRRELKCWQWSWAGYE